MPPPENLLAPVAASPLDAYRRRIRIAPFEIKKGAMCWKIKVNCPYCGNQHKHGGGPITEPPLLGDRLADCHYGVYNLRLPTRED